MTDANDAKTYALFSVQKNKKLIGELEAKGNKILPLPVSSIESLYSGKSLDDDFRQIIKKIKEFEWIIFTDVFAAGFFLEILENEDFDPFELDEINICSLGAAAADRLRFAQIHTDIIPQKNSSEAILDSIEDYIGEGEIGFAGKRFLVVKEVGEKPEFIEKLTEKGAAVSQLAVYRAEFSAMEDVPKIKALIKGGAADEIYFSTPEEFLNFKFLFREENLKKVLSGIKISVNGDVTFQTVTEHELLPVFFKA
jgi:uroporphyrinogen-III synthase